jgi:hypothetical protein
MLLAMNYVSATGDTVFKGSAALTVAPTGATGSGAVVQVPVHYTGTGSSAASLTISPPSASGKPGDVVKFTATALDGGGSPLPGTPIVFSSSDATVATIDAASGSATLGAKRGNTIITARTLTGQSATATISVTLPGSVLTATGGGTGSVGTSLPVTALVTASDGVPVAGLPVTFAVATGGGSVTPAGATTGVDGKATASWKLGTTVGAQTLNVTAVGSTKTVSATAEALKASKIVITSGPANGRVGQPFSVSAQVQDSLGTIVKDFSGTLSAALGSNPPGASLGGATSATVSNGVATFTGLTVSKAGKGFTVVVSGGGLTSATSGSFDMAGPTATKLVFTITPPATAQAGAPFAVTVTAQDSSGATVTDFSETVGLQLTGGNGALSGTTSLAAVAGVASFDKLSIDRPGTYTLKASAGTLTPASSSISITVGDPKQIRPVRGTAQTGPAMTTLDTIIVRLVDAGGNGVPSHTVTFTVTSGGGTVMNANPRTDERTALASARSSALRSGLRTALRSRGVIEDVTTFSAMTDPRGEARAFWTLGPTVGAQSLVVSSQGVPDFNIGANATEPPPSQRLFAAVNSEGWWLEFVDVLHGTREGYDCNTLDAWCSSPGKPAVNPAGTVVAVPFNYSNNVAFFDPGIPDFFRIVSDTGFNGPAAAAFTEDGRELWIANAGGAGRVSIINMATSAVARVTGMYLSYAEDIAIAAGRAFVTSGEYGKLTIIDVASRTILRTVVTGSANSVAATPDGQWAFVSNYDSEVLRVKVSDGSITPISLPSGSSRGMTLSPDGTKLYVATANMKVMVIDVATSAVSQISFSCGVECTVETEDVAILNDGSLGFVSDCNGAIYVFNPRTGMQVNTMTLFLSGYITGLVAH